jgi:hypothetical protein
LDLRRTSLGSWPIHKGSRISGIVDKREKEGGLTRGAGDSGEEELVRPRKRQRLLAALAAT